MPRIYHQQDGFLQIVKEKSYKYTCSKMHLFLSIFPLFFGVKKILFHIIHLKEMECCFLFPSKLLTSNAEPPNYIYENLADLIVL